MTDSRAPADRSDGARGDIESDDSTDGDGIVPEPLSTPVSTGAIDEENAVFVLLGAVATVAVFVRMAGVAL